MLLNTTPLCAVGVSETEEQRLAELHSLCIIDTLPEKEYNDLVNLIAGICQTPISAVSLIDGNRVWAKAQVGLPGNEIPRHLSFCTHAIAHPDDVFIVSDALKDIRFSENPYVVKGHIRFYAGVPLVTKLGNTLGSFCVMDKEPRTLAEWQIEALKTLASQVVSLFELRKANIDLQESKMMLEAKNIELKKFAYTITHDIKTPANNLILASNILQADFGPQLGENGNTLLGYLNTSSAKIKALVDGVLSYYTSDGLLNTNKTVIDIVPFLQQMAEFLSLNEPVKFTYPPNNDVVRTNKVVLEQVLINLTNNAIKYNDKEVVEITYGFSEDDTFYHFLVTDNGIGIPADKAAQIFNVFTTLNNRDRYGKEGTGIGLATVKKLIERMGGEISVKSVPGVGTAFSFSLKK